MAFGNRFFLVLDGSEGVDATSAANVKFAFVFRVEVYQDVAFQQSAFQFEGAGHAGFFVDGQQHFNGAMLQVVGLQYCQCSGGANAVVSAQGGACGFYPLAINPGLNGVFLEIVLGVVVLLRHHVEVALKDDALAVFHARCGRLADNHVAHMVNNGFKAKLLAKVFGVFNDFFFLFRRVGNVADIFKDIPQWFWIKVFKYSAHVIALL